MSWNSALQKPNYLFFSFFPLYPDKLKNSLTFLFDFVEITRYYAPKIRDFLTDL
jgi:hypothetical protein